MIAKNSIVLVTGGHGFIGGHVARRLCFLGYNVRVTDVLPFPSFNAPRFQDTIVGNLCEPLFCRQVVQGVDIVLHFAATMGGMGTIHAANDFIIYQENHNMTLNLLAACIVAGVKRFLYASSACVYPESLQGADNSDISLKELDVWRNPPPQPQGLYGQEKLNAELVLHHYASSMEIRIARFHNVYGPWGCWYGGREKVPAAFLRKALAAKYLGEASAMFEVWGDGSQRRSFCYIDDAVDAVLRLLESNCKEPLNIGSDQAVTIQQLAQIAVQCAGLALEHVVYVYDPTKPVGVACGNSNNDFVHAQLGWLPGTTLADGMRETGTWIAKQLTQTLSPSLDDAQRIETLRNLQKSEVIDLQSDGNTVAILLPITSRGSSSPDDCLRYLDDFAQSLSSTTADDMRRLGERYKIRVYLAIDHDDKFLWGSGEINAAEIILRKYGFSSVVTLPPCHHPRGHVCALWRDCARRAWQDRCDFFILMGDDVVLQDDNWMSTIRGAFADISTKEDVPYGFGCVAFTDTSFPGMPTFPVIHRTHMDIFMGEVIPDSFINQDGDPFLFQLYRRWGCSRMVTSRIHNKLGGSGDARYSKMRTVDWTFQPLEDATASAEAWLRRHQPSVQRKLTLDVIIPCYRVDLRYLDAFLALNPSESCTVMFIIIVDDPESPRISELLHTYTSRPDVRIRINSANAGASASRNRGLQESAAEWVLFLDDDVSPDMNILVEAEKVIRAHPKAAGFVGNAQFPSADSVFTAAVHLAGVTYFWDIATKINTDLPWGVTANLIARRNVNDGIEYDLRFPKTGGGEDIDFCRRKRQYSLNHGGDGFYAAPDVVVIHPWWNGGRRSYWRFYMWSKGDGALIKLYPEHAYRDAAPNGAELLLLILCIGCCLSLGFPIMQPSFRIFFAVAGVKMVIAVFITNTLHDLYRHLWRNADRVKGMKTTVSGIQWVLAVVEATLVRIFSECGRTMGMLERGEFSLLGMRYDWFTDRWGDGPRSEERMNSRQRLTVWIAIVAVLFLI